MPKSTSDTKAIEAYIAARPPDVQHILEQVRETIRSVAPDVVEIIKYDMPMFQYQGTYLYVGAWKKHLGLYPVFTATPELEAELAPYRAKKDTVQFKYAKPIPFDLLARIARAQIRTKP